MFPLKTTDSALEFCARISRFLLLLLLSLLGLCLRTGEVEEVDGASEIEDAAKLLATPGYCQGFGVFGFQRNRGFRGLGGAEEFGQAR